MFENISIFILAPFWEFGIDVQVENNCLSEM